MKILSILPDQLEIFIMKPDSNEYKRYHAILGVKLHALFVYLEWINNLIALQLQSVNGNEQVNKSFTLFWNWRDTKM